MHKCTLLFSHGNHAGSGRHVVYPFAICSDFSAFFWPIFDALLPPVHVCMYTCIDIYAHAFFNLLWPPVRTVCVYKCVCVYVNVSFDMVLPPVFTCTYASIDV